MSTKQIWMSTSAVASLIIVTALAYYLVQHNLLIDTGVTAIQNRMRCLEIAGNAIGRLGSAGAGLSASEICDSLANREKVH